MFSKGKSKSNSKEHKNQKDKSKLECTFFHKKGHLRQDCFFIKKKQNQKKQKEKQQEEHKAEALIVEQAPFVYSDALTISENSIQIEGNKDTHDWVLDSGYSFYMTPLKGWFTTYKV